ncbi:MAG: M20/M25/M40 family metallo-hydrolase [Desulfobia sp.]
MFSLNSQRLTRTFVDLCQINSASRHEQELASHLCSCFQKLGASEIVEDDSAPATGSNTGNLIVRFDGNDIDTDAVFFNCHLDVVSPCHNVRVKERDGLFTSSGNTVLGADDKAGISIILEAIQVLQENNHSYCPFELVLTTCEEIGLLGAKAFKADMIKAACGYSLDSTGTDNIVTGAPASHTIDVDIHGRSAHAGLHPENGINAIQLAGQALSQMPLGRLDPESTANIGMINGGQATNIIPDFVNMQGEIRSHSRELLDQHLAAYRRIFQGLLAQYPDNSGDGVPSVSFRHPEQYPLMNLAETLPVIQRVERSAGKLGRKVDKIRAGGGSDANFFNYHGIPTAILGVGMDHVHSTAEQIRLSDMLRTGELICAILTTP